MTGPVAYVTAGPASRHDTGPSHPEMAARLDAVERGVEEAHLGDALVRREARPARTEELARVHPPGHLERVRRFVEAGGRHLDPDTVVSGGSWEAALTAAGGVLTAVEALRSGEAGSAFVAARPPGHHATATAAMGFCLLNNVAVAAADLVSRGERVLVVDWDVHHGNGTQDIFWDDPRVLYVSTHQWPCYPGTGRAEEVGGPAAPGSTVNVPLPPGATGDVAVAALEEVAQPAVEELAPTWVLVSAGFDAHRDDPLAELSWSAGDYALLTGLVASWAPPGRLVAVLEGGYDLGALARSVRATVETLAGEHSRPEPPTAGGPGREQVRAAAEARRRALG